MSLNKSLSPARLAVALVCAFGFATSAGADEGSRRVVVLDTPDGGIQPQAAIGSDGTLHLVYLKGDPANADVYYSSMPVGSTHFSAPIRVNSQPGSAIAIGTIRGAQLAVGKGGRVHVAWNGSQKARPKNPIQGTPMLYSRSNEDRTAFEPQRNLMKKTFGLDGGGTVAADAKGHVYVAWHGKEPGAVDGEMGRRLWLAHSDDEGATFADEVPALKAETGACGCCGSRGFADRAGNVYFLYRAAGAGVDRDMILASSRDGGQKFQPATLDRWRFNNCPMSSESIVEGPGGVLGAWETKGSVFFAPLLASNDQPASPESPPGGEGNRKHPALAVNAKGEVLLAWAEGTGWQKGGALAWQVFDAKGQPTAERGRVDGGVGIWSLPAAVARADGIFVLIH